MARRGGKAASRRERQRRAQRAARSSGAAPQASAPIHADPEAVADAMAGEPSDAFEKADAEVRNIDAAPFSRAAPRAQQQRTVRARTSDFHLGGAAGSSRLSERAAAEYHYVARDLRNIGVLMLVMAVLLALSVLGVNLLSLGAAAA